MKTYVTFGQTHRHEIDGVMFDNDCVAVIEHEKKEEGRAKAVELFGLRFFTTYLEDQFDFDNMKYFPRGFVAVP